MKSYLLGLLVVLGIVNFLALLPIVIVLVELPYHGYLIYGMLGVLLTTLFLISIGIVALWPKK